MIVKKNLFCEYIFKTNYSISKDPIETESSIILRTVYFKITKPSLKGLLCIILKREKPNP